MSSMPTVHGNSWEVILSTRSTTTGRGQRVAAAARQTIVERSNSPTVPCGRRGHGRAGGSPGAGRASNSRRTKGRSSARRAARHCGRRRFRQPLRWLGLPLRRLCSRQARGRRTGRALRRGVPPLLVSFASAGSCKAQDQQAGQHTVRRCQQNVRCSVRPSSVLWSCATMPLPPAP